MPKRAAGGMISSDPAGPGRSLHVEGRKGTVQVVLKFLRTGMGEGAEFGPQLRPIMVSSTMVIRIRAISASTANTP